MGILFLKMMVTIYLHGNAREGKGFSRGELTQIPMTPTLARYASISVDTRRKTVYDNNVAELQNLVKEHYKQPKKYSAQKKSEIPKPTIASQKKK